ncbi:MAG TPA: ABC transporter permease [Bacillota bacterium]|nr:ABC transporter permease [Bacillota bacterium]
MNVVLKIAGRNIRLFFRDKTSVFFSFLSVIIIIGLYVLFLGDTTIQSLANRVSDPRKAKFFADTWIMAGVLVANAITSTLGALEVLVNDEHKGIVKDFMVSPVKRWQLVLGYVLSTWVVGAATGLVMFAISQAYIVLRGGDMITLANAARAVGLILLNVLAFSSFNFLIVSFIKTNAAFSTFSTLVGTLIGFVTGVYVPIGVLPGFLQKLILMVPATHGASAMRQLYMDASIAQVGREMPPEVLAEFLRIYGVNLRLDRSILPMATMIFYIAVTGAVFFALSVVRLLFKKSR